MDNISGTSTQDVLKPTVYTLFSWKVLFLLCLTIGLAPFTPEPHIWGKLKWVMGGAHGMAMIDWLDLLFHGIPWCLLLIKAIFYFFKFKLLS